MELKCSTKSRGRLNTAFNEVIGARGTVRHLIPRIEVEIDDLEPTIEAEDVEDAIRSFFNQETELNLFTQERMKVIWVLGTHTRFLI